MHCSFRIFLLCFQVFFHADIIMSIRMISIDVPSNVIYMGNATLSCDYDLESDQLYSLKWYKKSADIDQEFYSYLPTSNQQIHNKYPPGIHVDEERSSLTGQFIYLYNIDLDSEGWYKCEVSAEHTFQTTNLQQFMRVLVPPKMPPIIKGEIQRFYNIGDKVNISCTTQANFSRPQSQLKWFINEKEAPPENLIELNRNELNESKTLCLVFTVKKHHFAKGKLNLKCMAFIEALIEVTSERVLNGTNKTNDIPIMVGLKSSYLVNDLVDVNCSVIDESTFTQLQWYIQGEKANVNLVYNYENSIGLKFHIRPYHLDDNGLLVLKCTAIKNIEIEEVLNDALMWKFVKNSHFSPTQNYFVYFIIALVFLLLNIT